MAVSRGFKSPSATSFYALGKSLAQKWPFFWGFKSPSAHKHSHKHSIYVPNLQPAHKIMYHMVTHHCKSCITWWHIILCAAIQFGAKTDVSLGLKSFSAHKNSHKHSIYAPNLQPEHKIMYHMVTYYSVRCDIVWRKNGHFLGFKVLFGTQKQP